MTFKRRETSSLRDAIDCIDEEGREVGTIATNPAPGVARVFFPNIRPLRLEALEEIVEHMRSL